MDASLDDALTRPRVRSRDVPAMSRAAIPWSEAIWAHAQASGPLAVTDAEIALGVAIASRPVFICGVHRSGTTLMRNLLDSHPALAVLPSEGTFATSFEPKMRELGRDQRLSFVACEWLRRLANPTNQAPYWLLGRTTGSHSPYVAFGRALMAWWNALESRFGRDAPSWPLAAVALAYAQVHSGISAGLRMWVEKTPTNERLLERLWREFPEGKVIHVVRDPTAVFASNKASSSSWRERARLADRVLRDLDVSFRTAQEQRRAGTSARYQLVRFEDLLENTEATLGRLATFLDIEALPVLMCPSIAGLEAVSNSSYAADGPPGRIEYSVSGRPRSLTRLECARVAMACGEAAADLGYNIDRVAPWRRTFLRFTFGSR